MRGCDSVSGNCRALLILRIPLVKCMDCDCACLKDFFLLFFKRIVSRRMINKRNWDKNIPILIRSTFSSAGCWLGVHEIPEYSSLDSSGKKMRLGRWMKIG